MPKPRKRLDLNAGGLTLLNLPFDKSSDIAFATDGFSATHKATRAPRCIFAFLICFCIKNVIC